MALKGDNKRDYQREYMRLRRGRGTGSNRVLQDSEIDRTQMSALIKKETGLTETHWRNKGFTPLPNIILNNPAVPRCVTRTYQAVAQRAFGKRFSVFVSQETLANDVSVSSRTVRRHLAVLEALGFVKCIRIGRGMTNTIVLTLKMRLAETGSLTKAIAAELGGLSAHVLSRDKLTMKDALKLVSRKRKRQPELNAVVRQAQQIVKHYEESR